MLLAVLFAMSTTELRLELVRESLTATHYRYRRYEQGLPTDEYVTTEAPIPVRRGAETREGLRIVDGHRVRRRIVEERTHEPYAIDTDAATGLEVRRTPLFFRAKAARVFDPNPVVTLNAPELQDLNDAAGHIPGAAYRSVTLPDSALHGPWVTLVDRQPRNVTPPEGALEFSRDEDGFEDVNVYYHVNKTQEYIQSLGFNGGRAIAPYAVEADAHASSGDDNSFFVPSGTEAGKGTLFYGEGGTDDAEDADIVVHEYAHALMEWIAPGTFGGAFASESRALAEGIGDYWAFSAHYDARRASGRDPFCFADWDARCWLDDAAERCVYPPGSDCLRRLDSTATMGDYDRGEVSGVEHRNGAIWSSALREIRTSLPREIADTLVLESLFGAPPRPTFAVMARRLMETDRLLYQGTHGGTICSAMYTRGILTECDARPRGAEEHFQSGERGLVIPENTTGITSTIVIADSRAIEKLFVRVDIAHTARGDLQIELIAPDGTVILLQPVSSSRTHDIHVTYGLTATPAESLDALIGKSAAGTWTLHVADRAPLDRGTLQSWGLDIRFAGEVPVTARPRNGRAQMIPVAAHLYGISGGFVSDLRLANVTAVSQEATLVFTPSRRNGLEEFAVVRVLIAPGETVAFYDVVDRVFHTAGSGTLEVLGEVEVMSRLVVVHGEGTLGQDVPPALPSTAHDDAPLIVTPWIEEGARYNLGITETGGSSGTVRVGDTILPIAPYSHLQFPVTPGLMEIRVIAGDARVVAYLSQVRNDDAMFIPAQSSAATRSLIAPVITGQGSEPPVWRSDLWLGSGMETPVRVDATNAGSVEVTSPAVFPDVLARLFQRTVTVAALHLDATPGLFAATRIVHGETTQFVPFLDAGAAPALEHLLFVENDDRNRTNLGIVALSGTLAEVTVYDASGVQVQQQLLFTAGGLVQMPVGPRVTNGRAVVRFLSGRGHAYASLIDQASGDATFFAGRP